MKITKFIYALAAVATLSLGSCNGFLDTPTDTRVELLTVDQLKMLMNSAYPQSNYAWPCEIMSDNLEDNNAPDENGLRYNLSPYDRGDDEMFRFDQCYSSSASDSPFGIWESFYNSIATANHVLEAAGKIGAEELSSSDQKRLNAVKGEALMLRSYCHFILAQVFCMPYNGPQNPQNYDGITYITEPENTVKPEYQRPKLQETYEMIVKDFEEAYKMIDNTLYDQPKYHFNTTAAAAYGARLFLVMRQYKKAFNYANIAFGASKLDDPGAEAVTANAVDATPYMADTYNKLGQFYYLSDFGYYHNSTDKQGNFLIYPTYSIVVRHLSGSSRYGNIRNALNSTMHSSGPAWSSFKWSSGNGAGGSFSMHPSFNGCSFINGKSDYGYFNGVNAQEFFEYTDKVSGIGYAHVTRREFAGEENLFNRAEARLFLGDINGALADLDVWEKNRRKCPAAAGDESRFRDLTLENIYAFYVTNVPENPEATDGGDSGYGICKPIRINEVCAESDAKVDVNDPNVYALLQCIQHFRRIEMVGTGMRWFDIKRLGLEYSHFVGKDNQEYRLTWNDPRKAIQIPSDVIGAGYQANPRGEDLNKNDNTEKVVPISRPVAGIK